MLEHNNEAMSALKKAIQIKPRYAQARYGLALSYLMIGDRASALMEHHILRNLDPKLASQLLPLIERKIP
jgi:Flp pilus assembly protein TadD